MSYLDEFVEDARYLDFARVGPVSRAVVDATTTALPAQASPAAAPSPS